jgi:hypothetical protein
MPIVKIKVCDPTGAGLATQTVKLSGCGELQTGPTGWVQFLTDGAAPVVLEINGVQAWAGPCDQLNKEECFTQSDGGFQRA